jgi:hypothetical protein
MALSKVSSIMLDPKQALPANPDPGMIVVDEPTPGLLIPKFYNGTTWMPLGGGVGATGGGTEGSKDAIFVEADTLVTNDYTIGSGAMVSGITTSIATPCVVTMTNDFIAGQPVRFTTTGALPTGLSTTVAYYVIAAGLSASSFRVSTTVGGAAVNTSGTQSGVHSCGKIKNAVTPGPLVIADGKSVVIPSGSNWTITGG